MRRPRRTLHLLGTLAFFVVLVPSNATAAARTGAHRRGVTHGHSTKPGHAAKGGGVREIRVCWTSKRHHARHPRRVCHLRARGAHKPSVRDPHAQGEPTATQLHNAQKRLSSKKRLSSSRAHVAKPVMSGPPLVKPVAPSPTPSRGTSPSAAAVIAGVLQSPCQDTELTPQAGNLEAVRAATFCLVNQERARHGEPPLQQSAQLEQAAQGHSDEMLAADYFEHISPSGETPLQRVRATGYLPGPPAGYAIGENIAWGTLSLSTPSAIVAAWIASPEHEANILNPAYRDAAVGVTPAAPASVAQGQPGAVYAQEFGVVLH